METGIERINLRRASLPAGLWTSNFSTALIDEESCKHNDEVDLPIARTLVSPLRCKPPSPQMNKDDCIQHGTDSANNVLVMIIAIAFVVDSRFLFFRLT